MGELPPANIIIMEGHEAHMRALRKYGRRLRFGGPFGAVIHAISPKKPQRTYAAQAPMRYLNRFSCLQSGVALPIPRGARIQFEMGLALRIGETHAKALHEDDAMDPIYGYAAAIVLDSPDLPGWGWLVVGSEADVEECEDPYCRTVTGFINSTEIGCGDTDGLTHSIAALVAQASRQTGVHESDLIFTGAAGGCSTAASHMYLSSGDTLRTEIAGLEPCQLVLE